MDKKKQIILMILVGLFFFSLNFNTIFASDDDDDGVDDDFEDLNKRDVDIEIEADRVRVESALRRGDIIDEIQLEISNDSEGLSIEVGYESEKIGENVSIFELEFGVIFRKLIEFVDMDGDNSYNPMIDDTIQEFNLTDFQAVKYSQISISADTKLHYFIVNTTNGIFTSHIYFSEEFYLINDTLITPVQSKIDIEITNFVYSNSSSQLALYSSLESENDYEAEDETEDERRNYSMNEMGVKTEVNNFTGIFAWKTNATIDGISRELFISDLGVDDYDDSEQKIYLSYHRGIHIHHDPKVGIEGIFRIQPAIDDPLFLIIFIGLATSLSISIGYGIYHFREKIFQGHYSEVLLEKGIGSKNVGFSSDKIERLLDNKRILSKLQELSSSKEIEAEKLKLTALSEDFFKIINMFEWDEEDLVDFIREMISLTPEERKTVFNEIIDKSEQQMKNRLDDTKRLYT